MIARDGRPTLRCSRPRAVRCQAEWGQADARELAGDELLQDLARQAIAALQIA